MTLNSKQRKTLEAIFERPTRANIVWDDIEKLLIALGAERKQKGGSIVGFKLGDVVDTFHRPHPSKEAYKPLVERVRAFLIKAGHHEKRD